jgi:hypothetical protein
MTETLNFFVFNIKLQSDKSGEARTGAYISLITRLTEKPYKVFATKKTEAVVLYGSTNLKDGNDTRYLYGRAAKGFFIAGEKRNILKDGEVNIEVNDENQLINPEIVRYMFYPEAHRLFVEKKNGGPTQTDIEDLLNSKLPNFILPEEKLEIVLEKDESTIKEIFEAKVVHSISYKVSYTNEDFLEDLADDFDRELKDTNIGELIVIAKADNHLEGLKINESRLLGGGLKLAESNGEIKSASITPNDGKGKLKKITNKNRPKVLSLKFKSTDIFWERWYENVVKIYRSN